MKDSSQNGDYTLNPFYLEHCDLNFLQVCIDGEDQGLLQPQYGSSAELSNYIQAYNTLRDLDNFDGSIPISRRSYFHGFTIYRYTTEKNEYGDTGVLPLKRRGHLNITMRFAKQLEQPVAAIILAKFPSGFKIDSSRAVYDL